MRVNNLSGPVILSLIIGLIMGFALGVLWQNGTVSDREAEETEETIPLGDVNLTDEFGDITDESDNTIKGSFSIETVAGSGSVSVEDQPAGESVFVSDVEMGDAGWIAVREEIDGEQGNILGATYREAGSYSDVTVRLLRGTEVGETYHVVLFNDNGDQLFNYTIDFLVEQDEQIVSDSMVASD